jgi:hypothetical protein
LTCDFWAENAEKKCKGRNNGKNKGDIQSLRPAGFAPAFGRAVAPFGAAFYGMRERMPFRSGGIDGWLKEND